MLKHHNLGPFSLLYAKVMPPERCIQWKRGENTILKAHKSSDRLSQRCSYQYFFKVFLKIIKICMNILSYSTIHHVYFKVKIKMQIIFSLHKLKKHTLFLKSWCTGRICTFTLWILAPVSPDWWWGRARDGTQIPTWD